MSFFQPLITTAFSSYPVSRGASFGRAQDATENRDVNAAAQNSGVAPSQQTQSTQGIEKSQESDRSGWNDRSNQADFGKPHSASGDVLDLSDKALQSLEAKDELNQAAKEKADDLLLEQQSDNRTIGNQTTDNQTELASDSAISVEQSESDEARSTGLQTEDSELSSEEKQQVDELKARDAEVRRHEQQHVTAGGQYVTGGPSYTYQTGPDGRQYAIGGEVGIDISPVEGDPEATIRKMQTVAAAATAPAEPSSQDLKVAASARQAEAQARSELAAQKQTETSGKTETNEKDAEKETATVQSSGAQETNATERRGFGSNSIATSATPPSSVASQYQAHSVSASDISISPALTSGRTIAGQTSGSLFSAFA